MNPQDLKYTQEHEWVKEMDGNSIRFGITDFAQDSLGDIVFVSLPNVGAQITAGQPCGEVESTKSVSDIFAPVTGTVIARNETLDEEPAAVNTDPYGAGWLMEVSIAGEPAQMMDNSAYEQHISAL